MAHIEDLYLTKRFTRMIKGDSITCEGYLHCNYPENQVLMGEEELYEYGMDWKPLDPSKEVSVFATTSSLIVRGMMTQIAKGSLTIGHIHYIGNWENEELVDTFNSNGQLTHKAPDGYFNVAYLAANELVEVLNMKGEK